MIEKANANKAKAVVAENVHFVEGELTSIPLPDCTADCIISNCVINLVPPPQRQRAFDEMHRLLRPGGRVAISDILAKKDMSDDMRTSMALYVGCIAGASRVSEYEAFLRNAGFTGMCLSVWLAGWLGCLAFTAWQIRSGLVLIGLGARRHSHRGHSKRPQRVLDRRR